MSFSPPDQASALVTGSELRKRPTVPWKIRFCVLVPSVFLLAIASACPAIYFLRVGGGPENWYGIEALLLGWQGFFVEQFGWFANPILFLAYILVLFRQFMIACVFAIAALLIALRSSAIIGQQVPADEGNVNHLLVTGFGIGYKIWLASIIAAVVMPPLASIFLRIRRQREGRYL